MGSMPFSFCFYWATLYKYITWVLNCYVLLVVSVPRPSAQRANQDSEELGEHQEGLPQTGQGCQVLNVHRTQLILMKVIVLVSLMKLTLTPKLPHCFFCLFLFILKYKDQTHTIIHVHEVETSSLVKHQKQIVCGDQLFISIICSQEFLI